MVTNRELPSVVSPQEVYINWLWEVRLPPKRSQAVPFVAQEDAAPRMGCSECKEITGTSHRDELIWWYRARCGKSEEAHSIMKEDLAGGKLPSQLFGADAAWWQIMILAFNVSSAMKRLALGETWGNRRMKAIRFWLINLPGLVHEPGRQLFVRLVGGIRRTRYS